MPEIARAPIIKAIVVKISLWASPIIELRFLVPNLFSITPAVRKRRLL